MRHHIFGKKLGRDVKERNALFRSLIDALITHGKIETTLAKAQAMRSQAEKLITHAKNNTVASRRKISFFVQKKASMDRLMNNLAPAFAQRQGGYTRMHRTQTRPGDNGQQVVLEWVTDKKTIEPETEKKQTGKIQSLVKAVAAKKPKTQSKPKSEKTKTQSKTKK